MFKLELLYLNEVCQSCLSRYGVLNYLYVDYIKKNPLLPDDDYDYHHPELHEKLYDDELAYYHDFRKINMEYFSNYDKLPQLMEYIFQVNYLAQKQESFLLSTLYPLSSIYSFQLVESVLVGIHLDRLKRTCSIDLKNVITYRNKIEEMGVVENTELNICFKDMISLKTKGTFYTDHINSLRISHCYLSKELDNSYCFSLLFPVDKDGLFIEIIASDFIVDVKPQSSAF